MDTIDEVGRQFVTFLKGFYNCHPEYTGNPMYLIAKWILNTTYSGEELPKIFAGMAFGNGFSFFLFFFCVVDVQTVLE